LEKWLNNNHKVEMRYMENHFDKRLDLIKLIEDSKRGLGMGWLKNQLLDFKY